MAVLYQPKRILDGQIVTAAKKPSTPKPVTPVPYKAKTKRDDQVKVGAVSKPASPAPAPSPPSPAIPYSGYALAAREAFTPTPIRSMENTNIAFPTVGIDPTAGVSSNPAAATLAAQASLSSALSASLQSLPSNAAQWDQWARLRTIFNIPYSSYSTNYQPGSQGVVGTKSQLPTRPSWLGQGVNPYDPGNLPNGDTRPPYGPELNDYFGPLRGPTLPGGGTGGGGYSSYKPTYKAQAYRGGGGGYSYPSYPPYQQAAYLLGSSFWNIRKG